MVPERLRWAVEVVDPSPGDRVLEVGGGPGVAAELMCARIQHGSMLMLDRSAVAVSRASLRAAHVAAGRLTVERAALAEAALDPESFDKAFCVDVNLFWTRDPAVELGALRAALRPAGRLWVL
jgi:ubiquinone/menaquinone biosynthesis C-methylase UbiE